MTLKTIIEALVFASQKPMMPHEFVQALKSAATDDDAESKALAKTKEEEIATLLEELKADYAQAGRGFALVEQVNGWHVVTAAECGKWVRQLFPESKPARLSGPALETLAIVAYRQPITKADIEAVRGVAVDGMMQTLLEKGLISIAGRAEVPGRPLLYQTTEHFLEHFGLRDVDELPNATELRRINLPTAPIEQPPAAGPQPEEPAPEFPLSEETPAATPEETPTDPAPQEQEVQTVEPLAEETPGEEQQTAE
ncbi:MAG TPA: SMC-Scp complex subunit ScpB [Chthoniobacteraceae bacterium]|nr:SMC-Scp complex subunit ScpB [Chthoniobacteraceae bacterium]